MQLTKRSKDMERLMTALELCRKLHASQVDKCGQPYWIHPFTVAMRGFTGYGEGTDYFLPYKGIFINTNYNRQYTK